MKPNFRLIVDQRDITKAISTRLISLTLSDSDGYKNDTLTIIIDDRNNEVAAPASGVEVECWLGYGDDLWSKGSFEVDEIKYSGVPETIAIICKGSKINRSLKQQRSQTYNNTTIGGLVDSIADRNGTTARVSNELRGIAVHQLNQVDESDLNLLTRLQKNYDAKFKALDSVLLFYKKDDFRKTTGAKLKTITIEKKECSSWSFSETDRSKYDSVSAKWRDNEAAETKEITIGSGESVRKLMPIFATKEEAKERAISIFNDLKRGKITGSITLQGNANIASEFKIKIKGFREKMEFKCESCTHTIDKNGYKTTLKLANKKQ